MLPLSGNQRNSVKKKTCNHHQAALLTTSTPPALRPKKESQHFHQLSACTSILPQLWRPSFCATETTSTLQKSTVAFVQQQLLSGDLKIVLAKALMAKSVIRVPYTNLDLLRAWFQTRITCLNTD